MCLLSTSCILETASIALSIILPNKEYKSVLLIKDNFEQSAKQVSLISFFWQIKLFSERIKSRASLPVLIVES